MWARLVQLILVPLVEKSVVALWKWITGSIKEFLRKRKLKKENTRKVEAYENSDSVDDSADSFDQLP